MASGPRADVEAVEPALKVIGKFLYIAEKSGAGSDDEVCNNVLSAAATVATSESMVTGVKAGLDPRIMLDVINASFRAQHRDRSRSFPRSSCRARSTEGFTPG